MLRHDALLFASQKLAGVLARIEKVSSAAPFLGL